jgi:RNA polymerase primary sigma factor
MAGNDDVTILDNSEVRVLSSAEERDLLTELSACRRTLAEALARAEGPGAIAGGDDPHTQAQSIASFYAGDGPDQARLGAVFRRYSKLRGRLALANMRLVAHVAKRFRDRGIAHADLIQEGVCGLLESIDRFDLAHGTKLATYATWWIRQAMQRAVASGAYPVRLSPRHLRQLAQNQDGLDRARGDSTEMIHRIHTATRPTISLDATLDRESSFRLAEAMSAPAGAPAEADDRDEAVDRLLQALRPRERQVLSLRFGLGGTSRLSLSQVGAALGVSKERVRQIQDRALEKLREAASDHRLADLIGTDE